MNPYCGNVLLSGIPFVSVKSVMREALCSASISASRAVLARMEAAEISGIRLSP